MSKFFGLKESLILSFTVTAIILISLVNFQISFRKVRDEKRRVDLGNIANALTKFNDQYGFYPPSIDGKIGECIGPSTKIKRTLEIFKDPVACDWEKSIFTLDPTDKNYPTLLNPIPQDPKASEGYSYLYLSNGHQYLLYGTFEGKNEPDFNKSVESLGLKCGNQICNSAKASRFTPIDKPLIKVR